MRACVASLGCKLNQAEAESWRQGLEEAGWQVVGPQEPSDVCIVNTCTVTHIADGKSRHLLRLARRRNPQALVVAVGCYAQRAPTEVVSLGGVNTVLSAAEKDNLVQIVTSARKIDTRAALTSYVPSMARTRTFVKIQEGCDAACSYCIVPKVRGQERSLPLETVMAQVQERSAGGYREVVLTGTNPGSYRYVDSGGHVTTLEALIERLLMETAVERLRISSLQPLDITISLLGLWSQGRLCRHFHLPLQSGSDAVLRRMRRRYSTTQYRTALDMIRELIPQAALTTDVMVGFPGETEVEFQESLAFCRDMAFASIHVFAYSDRPGTDSFQAEGKVMPWLKKERSRRMMELGQESSRRFRSSFCGQRLDVLWETRKGDTWMGLSDNYLRVFSRSGGPRNQITVSSIVSLCEKGLRG
ncbi:MAG: tRNA (N(6)-L-threonylcarbamoyladenosine(37)-C(2))-methylthiotransferase MtaB [Chloroflexi bacterium]|nr:tRNA (N(6)-L-threonylcarbamoyladenosine(37)-C(2))-methylthiotransferase MtaB [Chloroflexota bacterium]